jgi:hypothetical protein
VTQRAIKRAAIFIFAAVNGTWALAAYLAHKVGVPPRAIVFLLGVGVVLGNLATYAGIKLGATALAKPSWAFVSCWLPCSAQVTVGFIRIVLLFQFDLDNLALRDTVINQGVRDLRINPVEIDGLHLFRQ